MNLFMSLLLGIMPILPHRGLAQMQRIRVDPRTRKYDDKIHKINYEKDRHSLGEITFSSSSAVRHLREKNQRKNNTNKTPDVAPNDTNNDALPFPSTLRGPLSIEGYITATGKIQTASDSIIGRKFEIYGYGIDTENPPWDYGIFQESGQWKDPVLPSLRIAYQTGIKLDASSVYGGIRFYDDGNMNNEIFSVGDGDGNVRVANDLFVNDRNVLQELDDLKVVEDDIAEDINNENDEVVATRLVDADDQMYFVDPASSSEFNRVNVISIQGREYIYTDGDILAKKSITSQGEIVAHGGMKSHGTIDAPDSTIMGRRFQVHGVGENSRNPVMDYGIYQEEGDWRDHPALCIAHVTGIKLRAKSGNGGIRFFGGDDGGMDDELFSVGNGDDNVWVKNELVIGGIHVREMLEDMGKARRLETDRNVEEEVRSLKNLLREQVDRVVQLEDKIFHLEKVVGELMTELEEY
mmetsp:Transcript_6214/g.12806  ORF Transcript_6214/g.12806 Transcript_6214/m.12806 type:complete len:465 (+) Transcript_6214:84-1478(+)